MPTYLHPGVYVEEIPSGSKPIEAASTSVAAFVGRAAKGPVGEAKLIHSREDYVKEFGPIASRKDWMGLAVQGYYLNGGKDAYICRLANEGGLTAAASDTVIGQDTAGSADVIKVEATSEGDWGNEVHYKIVKPDQDSMSFDLHIGRVVDDKFSLEEEFTGLTMNSEGPNHVLKRVNGESLDVKIALEPAADPDNSANQFAKGTLTGGQLAIDGDLFTNNAKMAPRLSMTLNIDGLGAKEITVVKADIIGTVTGDKVATQIRTLVQGLGPNEAYQSFTCTYGGTGLMRRFKLTSGKSGAPSSVEVYGGELAAFLRLDDKAKATLESSAAVARTFADGLTWPQTLVVNIDDHENQTLELEKPDDLADPADASNDNDRDANGGLIAQAITNAVRAISMAVPAYRGFECAYNASDGRFTLTSGGTQSRQSSVVVVSGDLAAPLNLPTGTSSAMVPGRAATPGAAKVVPQQKLGANADGEFLGTPLAGGGETPPTTADYATFFGEILKKVRDVSILLLPGESWDSNGSKAKLSQALAHCEDTKSRVLIIDPPKGMELAQGTQVEGLGLPTSTYSVLYYPWVEVANPFYDVDRNPTVPRRITIAPSAFAAGMWSKVDGRRGVWKAPAGTRTNLLGVADLEYNPQDGEQDQLNPLGVNLFRKMRGPVVIWGSRTLSTRADPEWRYVPVRRTAIFIEQSIYNGIQWAVFEPNDHPLWASLRANIDSFMNGLFRSGAFQGAKASDAYYVRCGLGDTMTQGDIDRGQVIVIIGFAPLKPAEFVIVRIQQIVGQQ